MGRLFWKFFFSILLAQLAATVGIGGAFWLKDQARERARASSIDTSPSAEFLITSAAATLAYGGHSALRELIAGMRHDTLYVVDESGRELLGRAVAPELVAQAERVLAGQAERNVVRKVAAIDGHHYLLFLPFDQNAHPGGPPRAMRPPPGAGMRAPPDGPGRGMPPPERSLHHAAPLAAALLASLLFAALLAWYFARPIRALRSAFDAASSGDLAPRFANLKERGGDELNDLGRDFDRMSAQLRALMDAQRRLLHDVSHELRSPLARLQAAIGLAIQQPDKVQSSLDRIERESVRMDKLVGELLTLSRLEAAAPVLDEDVHIDELVAEIAADARFEAGAQKRHLLLHGSTGAVVRGAPDLLWRAVENVVRNAIKHSPAGGTVEIAADGAPGQVRIAVLDRGPGIPDEDLKSVFEPFFRAAAHEKSTDGHGLGLAIAQRVIQAHGGSIAASNRDGGGLRVDITLPAA